MGLLRCVLEDIIAQGIAFKNGVKKAVRAQRENLRQTRKRRRAKKKEEVDGVWVGPTPMDEVEASESSSRKAREKKRRRDKRRQRKEAEGSGEVTDLENEIAETQEPNHDESPQWPEDDQEDRQVV